MKKIEAIIRKTKFEDVKDALLEADIEWFSYYDVRGIGKSRQARIYRGVMYDTSSIERILISTWCATRMRKRPYKPSSNLHKPVKSATDASSSSPLRMPYAYVLQREATSHSTMPNKKDNGQLQTTTKKIQYN